MIEIKKFVKSHMVDITLWLVFLITTISFILLPLHLDIRVMLASAHQADYVEGNWFYAVLNSWELKGFLNRTFIYILYKFANLFVPYASGAIFEILVKSAFALFTIGVISLSVHLASLKEKTQKIKPVLLICSAIFACLIHSHIQAEMICTILLILTFSIYINTRRNTKYNYIKLFVAGLIAASVCFYKSIFALMAVVFFSAIYLWNKTNNKTISTKEVLSLIAGGCCSIILGLIIIFLLNPEEIEWIKNAGMYENTIIFGARVPFKHIWNMFTNRFCYACLSIPVVFIGVIFGFKNFVNHIKDGVLQNIARLTLWFIPALIIVLANKYFTYHYTLFMIPAIFELYLTSYDKEFMTSLKNNIFSKGNLFIFSLIILFFVLIKVFNWSSRSGNTFISIMSFYVVFVFIMNIIKHKKIQACLNTINFKIPIVIMSIIYFSYISIFSDNFIIWKNLINCMYETNSVNINKLGIDKKEQFMYFGGGMDTYNIGNRSYLKEHFPLSLQRITEGSVFEDSKVHTEALDVALKYDGKYIALNRGWFFGTQNERNLKIQEKIKKEYHKIGELIYISVGVAIFKRQNEKDFIPLEIYERN